MMMSGSTSRADAAALLVSVAAATRLASLRNDFRTPPFRAFWQGGADEDRDLQHQQRQPAASEPPRLARGLRAGRRLPAGAEGDGRAVSGSRDPQGWLWAGAARAKELERRRDPGSRGR